MALVFMVKLTLFYAMLTYIFGFMKHLLFGSSAVGFCSSILNKKPGSHQNNLSLKVFTNPLLMEIILKQINCFDVQRLRKVSRDIRHVIDALKPDPHITYIAIEQFSHKPEREDRSFHEEDYTETNFYISLENNECKSMFYDDSKFIPDFKKNRVHRGDAVLEMAANDFKVILQHQKSILDTMIFITGKKCMKSIGNVLKSRDTPLGVKSLFIVVKDEKEVMNILPYLGSVENISIMGDSVTFQDVPNLQQWRNAIALNMHGCTIRNSIQELNLLNFEKVDIKVNTITSDDMIYLKENLEQSVKPFKFEIAFKNSTIDYRRPLFQGVHNNRGIWFFPLSTADKFLHIIFSISEKRFIFESVDRNSVPQQFLARFN